MLVYADRCFCSRKCGNKECPRNLFNVPDSNKLPGSVRGGDEECKKWKEYKGEDIPKWAKMFWKE